MGLVTKKLRAGVAASGLSFSGFVPRNLRTVSDGSAGPQSPRPRHALLLGTLYPQGESRVVLGQGQGN